MMDFISKHATVPKLYPILDTEALARRGCAVETAAEAMLESGARILQFRHKGHYSRAVFEQAERVAALVRRAGALFIIDDRADIALLLDAGLHVGQDDLPPCDARRLIGPGRMLGFSTHNPAQFARRGRRTGRLRRLRPGFRNALEAESGPGGRRRPALPRRTGRPASRWWRSAASRAPTPSRCSRPAPIPWR